jgi:D-arabinose 1-dehydrogenase-like Zn-dependent alcohol dehydrogenase
MHLCPGQHPTRPCCTSLATHTLGYLLQGEYQVKPKLPFIPGSEVSGIIVELGEGVKKFRVGDKASCVAFVPTITT